jgi:hypothetical protein
MTSLFDVQAAVDQLRAAELLARQPLDRLPRLDWSVSDAGTLVGSPAPHTPPAEARAAWTAWVKHLGLRAARERHRNGCTHLRAQGHIEGTQITVWALYRDEPVAASGA